MDENKIELSGIFKNGYGIIPKALMKRKNLRISEKAILAYFLSYTGGGNICFPSYAQICEDLQISKTTLSKCIHSIEGKGYIKISALYPNNKLRHNYKYTLIFEGLKNEPSKDKKIKLPVKENKPTCIKNLNSNNNINNNNNINKKEYQYKHIEDKYISFIKTKIPSYVYNYGINRKIINKLAEIYGASKFEKILFYYGRDKQAEKRGYPLTALQQDFVINPLLKKV